MLFVSVKNWLTLRPLRLLFFRTKILSEDPYLTQEKKLKNWYIQEYTTGTTFEQKYLLKNVRKNRWRRPWWTSNAKSSTIRWLIQAYEWLKWPVDDAVESHRSVILFYWNFKELEQYDGTICILLHCDFYKQEWSAAPSIFNIKARGLAHCLY